ncbi:type II secretion system protein M [Aliiglaciecola sp. CAU 1673]|uniref:type II secretion system protein M n=1 Tax=Aliiglaciecola sp. CAU 1673 TaxID=3032595 RepID=UPI0023DC681B|nr:type II secretion system protein M [Aliiglaciecola sp. CAU 1673]MDF2179223.1 type II secretion system protein M [Aliiglaciecola sp. CAU 1673]
MKQLVEKFRALSEREQRLVIVAALFMIIGLFYFLIWSPMNQSIERNKVAVQSQQELLAWVQKNANKAIQLKGSGKQSQRFSGSLTQAVNQHAGRSGISIARMQPQGEELLVWVDEAPFNQVLAWLQAMEQQGIQILDADFSETSTPGQIKIRRLQLGTS